MRRPIVTEPTRPACHNTSRNLNRSASDMDPKIWNRSAMTLSDILPKLHYPTRLEKLADGWVHGIGLGVFSIAVLTLLGLAVWQGGFGMAGVVAIYAVCLLTMIGCSMAYNMAENAKRKSLLR